MSGTLLQTSSGTISVASGGAAVNPVGYGYYPPEGSRAVSVQYAWSSSVAAYGEDLSQLVARGVETSIQSVYIDNSGNTGSVQIVVAGTGQVIICQAGYQGVAPILFTGAPYFSISAMTVVSGTPAVGVTRMIFLNVPCMTASFWSAGANIVGGTYYGQTLTELTTGQSQALSLNPYGALYIDGSAPVPTYNAFQWYAVQANASDIFTLYGSSTKTVAVHSITAIANFSSLIALVKRSSVNTGGTTVAVNLGQYDSNDASPTASALGYNANPTTLGTSIGIVGMINIAGAFPNQTDNVTINFNKPIILRGSSQGLCCNLGPQAPNTAGAAGINIVWTEY